MKSTNQLKFLQSSINADALCKMILINNDLFDEIDFKKLIDLRIKSYYRTAINLDKTLDTDDDILNSVKRQLKVLCGNNLYAINCPWEEALKLKKWNLDFKKIPKSFNINNLEDLL